jgi:hypothetical protein
MQRIGLLQMSSKNAYSFFPMQTETELKNVEPRLFFRKADVALEKRKRFSKEDLRSLWRV